MHLSLSKLPRAEESWRLGLKITVFSALAAILFVLLAVPAMLRDRAEVAREISAEFKSGALITDNYFAQDMRRGRYLFNDCLIMQTLLLGDGSAINRAVSSYTLQRADTAPCKQLDEIASGTLRDGVVYPYSRYFWGAKAIVGPALGIASIDHLKRALSGLVYATLLGAAAIALTRVLTKRSVLPVLDRSILVIVLGLLFFYDLRAYTLTFAQGFSEWVLAAYLLFAAVRPASVSESARTAGLIALGALTAWFELLTGAMVMAIAIAVLVESTVADPQRPAHYALRIAGTVALSVVLPLLFLQVLVAIFGDPQSVEQFFYHVMLRMQLHHVFPIPVEAPWQIASNLHRYTVPEVFGAILHDLPLLTYGNAFAASLLFGASAVILVFATAWSRGAARSANLICCAVVIMVAMWYLAFGNHSAVHAFAMVRLMALVPICAALALMHTVESARRA